LVEHLAVHIGVNGLKTFDFLVLLGDQLLIHRGDLDEEIIVRQVEVGCEVFCGLAVLVELNRKTLRLVIPRNTVEIEKKGELTLTVVSEFNFMRRGAIGDQVTPVSTAPANSACSGNNWWMAPSTSS